MPNQSTFRLRLTDQERQQARRFVTTGKVKSRCLQRVIVLLKWDAGLDAKQIKAQVPVSLPTIYNVYHRYQDGELSAVIEEKAVAGQPPKLDARGEATLLALACAEAPVGNTSWTMQMLADKLVEMKVVESISDECVRVRLKKVASSRGSHDSGALAS
jgi:transposase